MKCATHFPVLGHYSTGKDRKFVLLEDVFKKFPNMPMMVEIKENNDLLIKKVRYFLQYSVSYNRLNCHLIHNAKKACF